MDLKKLIVGSFISILILCSSTKANLLSLSKKRDAVENQAAEGIWSGANDDWIKNSLYEGDIVLTEEQQDAIGIKIPKRQKRAISNIPVSRWSETIPYSIDPSLSYRTAVLIKRAIDFWQSNTCINFTASTSRHRNSLLFTKGRGCYSYIGKIWYWKQQPISLGAHCSYFHTIAHEIGHALGFFHEHNRADRDKYIAINFKNVKKDLQNNFKKLLSLSNMHFLPYDYASVMHYGRKAFSSDGQSTILSRDPLYRDTMGGATGPTFYDVYKMNYYYGCLNNCKHYRNTCKNGGYLHPRNCNQCVCPSSYDGYRCNERTSSRGCGETLVASHKWQRLTASVLNKLPNDGITYCYWWIKSKPKQIIEVNINSLKSSCTEGCINGGVEIKTANDKRYSGYRFCCQNVVSKRIQSWGPILPIIVYNKKYITAVDIYFRLRNY